MGISGHSGFFFDQFSIHCYAQVGLQEYHTLVNMFKWVGGCYVNLVFFLWLKYVYDQVIQELKEATANLKDHERWVVLLHDEMSIKEDLVCWKILNLGNVIKLFYFIAQFNHAN